MNIYQITFSPTGRTQKAAEIIGNVWEEEKIRIDLTAQDFDGSGYEFTAEDLCIVAVGVYGGRMPAPAAQRLKTLKGNGASVIAVAAYGNRAIDDCLLELTDLLAEQGFRCRSGIAAVVEHSMMPRFGAGRPDTQDVQELTDFARKIKAGLENDTLPEQVTVPGKRPYVPTHNLPLKFKGDKSCTNCGKCAKLCPVGAIPKDDPRSVDGSKCICCMRCTEVCPVGAKHMPGWAGILSLVMAGKLGGRKENSLYI